jgi:outer membrane biosynthesis protein TonB
VIDRVSNALAVILHIAVVLLLGRVTFAIQEAEPRKKGMEIEIIDLAHAMPVSRPVIADAPPATRSQPQARVVVPEEPETVAVRSAPVRPEPEIVPKAVSLDTASESRSAVPQPAPAPIAKPVANEPPQVASASLEAQPEPEPGAGRGARLDTAALSGLRNIASSNAKPSRLNSATISSSVGKAAPKGIQGLTFRQKIDLAEKVRAQVMPCWNPPPADGLGSASVRLSFRLDRDGRVVGQPVRSGVTGQSQVSTAYINLLTNSGRRAVLMCSPLRLPPELYEAWADVEVEFDPRDLR